MSQRPRAELTGLVTSDLAVLVLTRPHLGELGRHLAHPQAWVSTSGTDAAALALARAGVWLVAAWVAAAITATAAAGLPGTLGRLGGLICDHAAPAVLRRYIAGAIGMSVMLAPAAADAVTAPGGGPASVVPVAVSQPSATAGSPAGPAPVAPADWPWPTTSPSARSASAAPPVPWPSTPTPPRPGRTAYSGEVLVHRGDSLWAIAAHRLGAHATDAEIARQTARWYHANARVIGLDPDLIHPGQQLRQPTEKGDHR